MHPSRLLVWWSRTLACDFIQVFCSERDFFEDSLKRIKLLVIEATITVFYSSSRKSRSIIFKVTGTTCNSSCSPSYWLAVVHYFGCSIPQHSNDRAFPPFVRFLVCFQHFFSASQRKAETLAWGDEGDGGSRVEL